MNVGDIVNMNLDQSVLRGRIIGIPENRGSMLADPTDSSVCHLLRQIVLALVDQTETVQITSTPQTEGVSFSIAVHSEDIGKLIGKQGRTARSLRVILSAIGMKVRRRYSLDIVQ